MKKLLFAACIVYLVGMSSCFVQTYSVGDGQKSGIEEKNKSHFFLFGLIPGSTADPTKMAGGTSDYDVKIYHSFVDGLLNAITFGIYNPTTTIVTK